MDRKKLNLLIVEDHQIVRLALEKLLESIDWLSIIGCVSDGQAAVEEVLRLRPQLVAMDLGLPVLDGIEATRAIKAAAPDVRVLILTAHESDEFVFAALAAGADGYCIKNTSAKELEVALHVISTGACWLDPQIAQKVLSAVQPATPHRSHFSSHSKFGLTPRELEILNLIVEGMSNQQIAQHLFISPETVKTHISHIFEKLMVSDRTEAAVKAMREGLSHN